MEYRTTEFCGLVKRHRYDRDRLENRQIEQMLLEKYKEDYFQYELKTWARLNKGIAFIKRSFWKTWKPNLSDVKVVDSCQGFCKVPL